MTFGEIIVPITGGADDAKILPRIAKFYEVFPTKTTLFFAEPDSAELMVWSADGMVAGISSNIIDTFKKSTIEICSKIEDELKNYPERALLAEKQPSLRFTRPDDIAAAALFLCSPAADNITGTTITLDGGWTAR